MSIFADTLWQSLKNASIAFEPEQIDACEAYFKLVIGANKHMNLTRLTDEALFAQRHFADAALVLKFTDIRPGSRAIDIGTGAGFPGMPIKILRPDIDLTLLDSSEKKAAFVKCAAESIGAGVSVVSERAEKAAKEHLRALFDFAFSRAVAYLPVLLELCVPFLRTGGVFAAWKGESYGEELAGARSALDTLGCRVNGVHPVGPGAILLIQKQSPTPDAYPRRFAKIKSSPL